MHLSLFPTVACALRAVGGVWVHPPVSLTKLFDHVHLPYPLLLLLGSLILLFGLFFQNYVHSGICMATLQASGREYLLCSHARMTVQLDLEEACLQLSSLSGLKCHLADFLRPASRRRALRRKGVHSVGGGSASCLRKTSASSLRGSAISPQ